MSRKQFKNHIPRFKNHNSNEKRQSTILTLRWIKCWHYLIGSFFKEAMIKMLQWLITNSFETNEKIENFSKDWSDENKKNQLAL